MVVEENITKIKRAINDDSIIVTCIPPPKYLLPFLMEEKILFIYKMKEVEETSHVMNNTKSSFDSDSDELELTGHPLECPFSSDDDEPSVICFVRRKEEDKHNPLDLNRARQILSFANLNTKSCVPLCILTNGEDSDKIILLSTMKNDGWCIRSWINLRDFIAEGSQVTNVEHMISKHHNLAHINPMHTSSEVCCNYIIESGCDGHASVLQESTGCLELNLSWRTPSFNVPMNEATARITISSHVGHKTSEISTLWSHLMLLHDYIEIIKRWESERSTQGFYSRQCTSFPNIHQFEMIDADPKSVSDRLMQLLKEPNKSATTLIMRESENETKSLEETVRNITIGKKEHEFSDQLWTLLIECNSYEQVSVSFDTIFQQVRNGICKPYMKSTNISQLAHALRYCKNNASHFEMMLDPLKLLIEIGIEKLKKEYISIFLLAKIATSEQLCIPQLPKFPEINATDWLDICSKWMVWFLRVHIALQLMLLTESSIKFRSCIMPLTTLTLNYFLSLHSPIQNVVDPRMINSQSLTAPVNTRDINDLLTRKTPFNSWTLTLYSEVDHRRVKSIFHRDLDEIFPSSVGLIDEIEGDNGTFSINPFPYHCYDFHSVSDLFEKVKQYNYDYVMKKSFGTVIVTLFVMVSIPDSHIIGDGVQKLKKFNALQVQEIVKSIQFFNIQNCSK